MGRGAFYQNNMNALSTAVGFGTGLLTSFLHLFFKQNKGFVKDDGRVVPCIFDPASYYGTFVASRFAAHATSFPAVY